MGEFAGSRSELGRNKLLCETRMLEFVRDRTESVDPPVLSVLAADDLLSLLVPLRLLLQTIRYEYALVARNLRGKVAATRKSTANRRGHVLVDEDSRNRLRLRCDKVVEHLLERHGPPGMPIAGALRIGRVLVKMFLADFLRRLAV